MQSWKDKDVPGVADAVKNTQLKQDKKARQSDFKELLRMVKEGRLHEADERQLENLKLALELNEFMGSKGYQQVPAQDPAHAADAIAIAVKDALTEHLSKLPVGGFVGGSAVNDPSRPDMKHTTLIDLEHTKSDLEVQGDLKGETGKSTDDAADKLKKLRKIKSSG